MSNPVYATRRRRVSRELDRFFLTDESFEVVEPSELIEQIDSDPNLHEIRPREILEVAVDESCLSVEEAARRLVILHPDVPDDMPIGLDHEILWELFGEDADELCLYSDEWDRTTGKILRRAVFINGRTFVPFVDEWSTEIHLVECESVAREEMVKPKFLELASIGFTEWNSMVSGYDGDEVGLISDEVAIWYTRRDEDPDEVRIFRMEPERHPNLILELMSSQFRPFMSKIMVEGLIGKIPEEFGDEIPAAWVEDEGSWTAITSLHLHSLLTSENPRSPIRQGILDWLLDWRRGENFEAWLAEYIEAIVDPNSLEYEKRLARQARVEAELTK